MLSIIPATFEQDQFSLNLDHQVSAANRLSGKFFFSNQPSSDPLGDGAALTRHEREETTYQRTLSVTRRARLSIRAWSTSCAPASSATATTAWRCAYLTNARIRHPEPVRRPGAGPHPDHDRRRRCRRRAAVRHARRRHAHLRPSDDLDGGNTLSLVRGTPFAARGRRASAALRSTATCRRRVTAATTSTHWFDFLTVGYANPADRNRARQIADTGLNSRLDRSQLSA